MIRILLLIYCMLTMSTDCSSTPSATTAVQAEQIEHAGVTAESHKHEDSEHENAYNAESDHADTQADNQADGRIEIHNKYRDDRLDEHDHGQRDEARERRGQRAHQHGHANLAIAWSGADLSIHLQTPGYNILGFENAPSSEAEQELLARGMTTLETEGLLRFSPEAQCATVAADVKTELIEGKHQAEDNHNEEPKGHTDFEASYTLHCKRSDRLIVMDASRLFKAFPNFASIRVQWISDIRQSAKTLTAEDSVLAFD